MADHEKDTFKSELGISRRDLLRRGAIAGGTLLWAAPIISSLRTPAFAQTRFACSCCECEAGVTPFPGGSNCQADGLSQSACEDACGGQVRNYCTSPLTGEGFCGCSGQTISNRACRCSD